MSRAIYGHITAEVKRILLGECITVDRIQVSTVRNAGHMCGKVFTIVAVQGESVTLMRVRSTRWGQNKARIVGMPIGSTLKVATRKEYNRLYKGARYAGVTISCHRKPGGGFKITRTA